MSKTKKQSKDFFELLPQAVTALKKNIFDPFFGNSINEKFSNESLPFRSELLTEQQLENHANSLAARHTLIEEKHEEQLLKRLAENERIILEVHRLLTETVKQNERITPAGEWLLDNFYLIEEQIYTGKKHLPKGYSKGLPRLLRGDSAGLPRVYDIAVEIISHSDGHVDNDNLSGFIRAYQKNTPLNLGELWAIPIMLRLALIENLRRLSIQIAIDINNKNLANHWAQKMMDTVENDPKNLVVIIADMAKSDPPMESSFVAEFTRKLQEKGNALSLPLTWIEQRLSEIGVTSNELIHQENQTQAADQVSISNSITSLRFLGTTDWREFVEKNSIVETILSEDVSGIYPRMDFYTRDNYRHAVEKIAKHSTLSEQQVAEKIIALAKEHEHDDNFRLKHVGYYLTGKGLLQTQKLIKIKLRRPDTLCQWISTYPLFFYLGSITLLTGLVLWPLFFVLKAEHFNYWITIPAIVVMLIAVSQLSISFVNWLSTLIIKPSLLPRLDFSKGIPEDQRSMVVIPTMLTNAKSIDDFMEGLEVRFLANRDVNLHFALLTDFKDAKQEHMPDDDELLSITKNKIIELNRKYQRNTNDTFFLFHRPRKWNKKESRWMGFERKRGKLGDLNALIKDDSKENFSLIIGDEAIYSKIKYIITLDTDTELPREAAWKMVGTMAHPLNRALYSEKKKRVTEGYTILQPRVSNSLPGFNSSAYTKIHSNEPGTDPYTKAISDVYQDLFLQGSFIGKGIYDIDAFEKVLKNRFPLNRILSHDLLEGCYSRSGLISDVQLYEDYPSSYIADMQRRHRWIRGDWQIARWIFPFVPDGNKKIQKNPLSLLSKWKIFDNLRRSLVPTALLLLLLFGWIFTTKAWFWTLIVLAIPLLSSVIIFAWEMFRKPDDTMFKQHLRFSLRSASYHFAQYLLDIIHLPYEVYYSINAILITFWRVFISHRKLLQWNPFSNSAKISVIRTGLIMWFAPVFSVAAFIYLSVHAPLSLIVATPVLIPWFISPLITWWVSRTGKEEEITVSHEENIYLRKLARKIWAFFETFITQEDNWLPPDNYQEQPVERIAHRTSPTNIGLSLLNNLTALEFGYITVSQLIDRTSNCINTMQHMERYRGHFYNWYDTISLVPLHPKYISTVDSGNLVGHLITLRQGLLAVPERKMINENTFEGILDTISIAIEKTTEDSTLKKFKTEIAGAYPTAMHNLKSTFTLLKGMEVVCDDLVRQISDREEGEYEFWEQKIITQIKSTKEQLLTLAPWLSLNDMPERFDHLSHSFTSIPTIKEIAGIEQSLLNEIMNSYSPENTEQENEWLNNFRELITHAGHRAKEIIITLEYLAAKCQEFSIVDYDFLYDRSQHLLTIGYSMEEHRRDNSFYDLLASEARLTTFVAIAQGKLPQESWFALGRQLTNAGATPILLSWSGSMFEYLMPLLVMPTYENTLLDKTGKGIVQKQIEYGKKRAVPWGISESGYNMVDAALNYQYKAFGVPGTGFKRGLGDDLVIAPYATIMALMVDTSAAYENLQVMKQLAFENKYGFYEAIDYTPSRLQRRQQYSIIKSFMAHHQGMSLLAIAYVLLNKPMQRLFESDVQVKSALLLLQERVPKISTFYSPGVHTSDISVSAAGGSDTSMRVINTPHTNIPEVQLLSNGRYHVMVTNSGGGYSRWRNISVNRWREDFTCDDWGTFCFIRDLDSNVYWSSAYQPVLKQGDNYEAVFSQGRAEFRRREEAIETHTEIVVSPEDDIELRRVHITNHSRKKRTIEITSYAEIVLTHPNADEAHPAFSNLFVQTQINKKHNAIIASRRPRTAEEKTPWMFHLMKAYNAETKSISYETNRTKFIGRGNTIHSPQFIKQEDGLSGTEGSVLDPIASIQYRLVIEPHETATIDMIFGVTETKDVCNSLIEKYQDFHLTNRVLELAWTHSQVILRQINATESDAQLYARLAGSIVFPNASLRADASVITKNNRKQSGLWGYSISGDLPIVLLQIEDSSNIDLVKQLIQAHAYWRMKGLAVDLVIWNEDHGGYRQVLHNQILSLISPGLTTNTNDPAGGIFIRSSDQISNEDRILFQTVAQIIISDRFGTLEEQLNRKSKLRSNIPYFNPSKFFPSINSEVTLPADLKFNNGIGGFTPDGKEYVIATSPSQVTPAPWVNVLANANFGCVISESGQSYTWLDNAHELRLTPWNNDPVSDLKGEAFYIRDEENGRFWSPSPLPVRGNGNYITRHGFGYSVFEYSHDGINSNMTIHADINDAIKFIVIKLHNKSNRPRRLSVTGYVEWVLGDLRKKSSMHTITEMHIPTGAVIAKNNYNSEFENKIAFFDIDDTNKTYTTDRTEFIGRNGTLSNPDALSRVRLSGKTGAALDPCAALQTIFDLSDDEEHTIIFRLGAGKDMNEADELIKKHRGSFAASNSFNAATEYWKHTLSAVQVETPDDALNIITNGWLNYQTLASRIWARSGLYQSGGAFGFRDQLQDVLSLIHTKPDIAREQIILCASRQFKEGDVQHWWHPPVGRGVRTTCSDDFLWLPYVTSRYLQSTNDAEILNENISFLEGRLLNAGEESYYDLPIRSDKSATLYEHCVKAIEHGLQFGVHGLPFIGSGDWNDGMDKVGEHGKGESVWLAFFLYDILLKFIKVAQSKNDTAFADKCREQAEQLKKNIHEHAWDGEWYRRAYFDDGTPLGSNENDECKIDSIAQSWSVLSKAGEPDKAIKAMDSAYKHLVKKEEKIIQLFNPPFDKSAINPGYIKGYVPGVRENGGQYTHAAIWLIMAFASLKEKQKAWELLQLVNPVNHGSTKEEIATYCVEPYVIAADVYAEPLHKGRGGWTWYTGSAGWMYQLITEYFLGIKKEGNKLLINPCIPPDWPSIKIRYRFGDTVYDIKVEQAHQGNGTTATKIFVDNQELKDNCIPLADDHVTHNARVLVSDNPKIDHTVTELM
ncbi:GH36-type glycosyl hydrolase domain-containing protein [Ferruginibacter albus]|uniref:GH36-type glycosyl hydrolase domain-containing protein n=1 Tax=Ferruginibacter albus TaxID=2875540 RepID=UPI001CC40B5A|nr:glucoamylase family protein [Ferruginibacter albus]UAY53560.1 cyclic beta 1-2 glucan synthetase [Ferruginibacter albus]